MGNVNAPIKFKLTAHARKQMYKRNIRHPHSRKIEPCSAKELKTIKKHRDYGNLDFEGKDYLRAADDHEIIYVCKKVNIFKYKVITAFRLPDEKPRYNKWYPNPANIVSMKDKSNI